MGVLGACPRAGVWGRSPHYEAGETVPFQGELSTSAERGGGTVFFTCSTCFPTTQSPSNQRLPI